MNQKSWCCLLVVFILGGKFAACHAAPSAHIEDGTFTASCDGTTQRYAVLWPDTPPRSGALDVLIALHGHGADRWQFIKDPRDECRAARDAAARHGFLLVSPDYRASTSWMGPNAESDVVQIIKELRQHQGARRVILCGASMGGSACLTFGVRHPELVDGVASMNGTANFIEFEGFQEAIQESFGGAKDQVPIEYRARSAEFYPEKLTMPVGITAGGKDELVPAQSVVRLAKNLAGMGRDVLLLYREEGGHSTSYEDASELLEFVIKEAAPLPGAFP